jgi:uncharacterized protein (DUF58 family)
MLTTRAWWFLLSVLLILVVGLFKQLLPLTLVGMSLLLWFSCQWLLFVVRLSSARRPHVEREVWDEKAAVTTLWAGQVFEVRLRLVASGWFSSPWAAVADHVPHAVEHLDGSIAAQGEIGPHKPLELCYRIRCGSAGLARFEGVRIQVADLQGFFYHVYFLHAVVILRILPMLRQRSGQSASKKRHNLLLPPGIHRFHRPGSGSELLDLRDYLPGDPPKTIAWKVSARRDRLITKEFESEVPLRCTLFVDTSNSVRVPGLSSVESQAVPHGKALDRLIELVVGILQACVNIRDLTGLILFDEQDVAIVQPGRGSLHLTECLRKLTDAATLLPRIDRVDPDRLLPLAYSFAQEVYPELLRPSINAMPFWMTTLLAWPRYPHRWRSLDGFLYYHKRWFFVLSSSLTSIACLVFPATLYSLLRLFLWLGLPALPSLVLLFSLPLLVSSSGYLLILLANRRQQRLMAWRKRLAAIVSARYGLGPGGLAVLLEDNDAFSLYLQRFLSEHQVPYTLPLYDPQGRYLFAGPEKVPVLADALLRAVCKGRDNELFVLLADLLELDDCLDPLLGAVRVALSRHHQVMLICPWPLGLARPRDNPTRQAITTLAVHGRPREGRIADLANPQLALWDQATTQHFHMAYQRLRRTFTRLGVSVICAASDEPVPLILSRLERLRASGRPPS